MTTRELAAKLGFPNTAAGARRVRDVVRELPGAVLAKPATGGLAVWNIPDDIDLDAARRIIEAKENGGPVPPFGPPAETPPPPPATPPIRGPESQPEEVTPTKASPRSSGTETALIVAAVLMLALVVAYSMGWLTPKPSQNFSGN